MRGGISTTFQSGPPHPPGVVVLVARVTRARGGRLTSPLSLSPTIPSPQAPKRYRIGLLMLIVFPAHLIAGVGLDLIERLRAKADELWGRG